MPADLMGTLSAYLETIPALIAAAPDGRGGVRLYTDDAIPSRIDQIPYLVIEDYEEDPIGESLDDEEVSLVICAIDKTFTGVRTLAHAVKVAVDTVATSTIGTRTAAFAWTGGAETGVVRFASRPLKVDRPGPDGHALWREDVRYVFSTTQGL